MALAVIQTGGKQYVVEPGTKLKIEKLDLEEGALVEFDALLRADGDNVMVGNPTVTGAKVAAKVEKHGRSKKVTVVKYKPKVRYRRKAGHRQPFTLVEITKV